MGTKRFLIALAAAVVMLTAAAPASAAPPWDGTPISAGLGPTYGESWIVPVPPTESVSTMQGAPLALIPYADIKPELDSFQAEAAAAVVPSRMTYSVSGQTAGGRDQYSVVINDLETPEQQRDYANWQSVRALMLTDPAAGQVLLASYGDQVKMVFYLEANIHGGEYEGCDAAMQIIRDLTVTPRGVNATVDNLLDHAIIVVNPSMNPDGRVQGTRVNAAGIDLNRDYFVQSQPEPRNSVKVILRWLPTAAQTCHAAYTPTLITAPNSPHNPGYEYDLYGKWDQLRAQANRADFAAVGLSVQLPVNDFGGIRTLTIAASPIGAVQAAPPSKTVTTTTTTPHGLSGGETVYINGRGTVLDARYMGTFTVTSVPSPTTFTYENVNPGPLPASGGGSSDDGYVNVSPGPALAGTGSDGMDDWGPFYAETYLPFFGVDGYIVEMTRDPNLGGRMGGKTAQYLAFYSSTRYFIPHRQAMLHDQLEQFRRGVVDAVPDPLAFAHSPVLSLLGFTDSFHNFMYLYPKAYVIPFGSGQRSNGEANRLAQWLLDNGIQLTRMTADFAWGGTTYQAGSYVVWMNQPLRGLARECLAAGLDISSRITLLYASPAAWSQGLMWGADVAEVPRGDATFAPVTSPTSSTKEVSGGVRGGVGEPADWYSVTLKGVREFRAVMGLLNDGVRGEIAEVPFDSTTGGRMPAGTLIFPADDTTASKLDAAGDKAGIWFERNVGVARPAATRVAEAPKVAVLRASLPNPPVTTAYDVMVLIFGAANVGYVTTGGTGAISLEAATDDPLLQYDFIWNEGAAWPATATAQARLNAFFARGGGYFGDNSATANTTFLTASGLVTGSLTLASTSSANTFGGFYRWTNVAGEASPITGAYPSEDYGFIPQRLWWFNRIPAGAVVDGRYASNMTSTLPDSDFISGLWRNRSLTPDADNGILLIRGDTTAGSRYVAHSTDLTSRVYPERVWPMIGQAANWTNLTDETIPVAYTISASAGGNGTISPSGDLWVAVGASETYAITPAAGYSVLDVLVDGSSVGQVTSYAFNNVTAAHTISATFAKRPSWKVTLKLSKSSVKVNTKVKYSGTVRTSTGRAGSGVVTIQKRRASGGSWIKWRTDRLNASGNYSITVKMTKRQTSFFRAKMPGNAVNRTGYSAQRKLRVY
jgi:hypothetical protein